MPSPFPGMDPFLEDPVTWPDLHHELISVIRSSLNRVLRPKYVARVEERIYVSEDDDPGRRFIIPDIEVRETNISAVDHEAIALVATAEPIVATTLAEPEIHDAYINVLDVATRKVVTMIELLSPTNKCPGSIGRIQYLRKRREVLHSQCHLVEIDLLREGTPTFPRDVLPVHHYAVHNSRSDERPKGRLWGIHLGQPLPSITIPLNAGDPEAPLDLQAAFTQAYDNGSYDLVVDYNKPCNPPLPSELESWATTFLPPKK